MAMFTYDPADAEPSEEQIKFSVYVHYIEATARVISATYGTLPAVATEIVSGKAFKTVQRRSGYDSVEIEKTLRNAWLTELQTRIPLLAQDLIPHSNHWLPVQVYYSVYLSVRAYFAAHGWRVDEKHEKTLSTLHGEILGRPSLYALPWRVMAAGDPLVPTATLLNCPVTTAYVNPLTSPRNTDSWNLIACLLRTTRRRRLEDSIDAWKMTEKRARRQRASRTGKASDKKSALASIRLPASTRADLVSKLRETTMFDALYRMRIRSNYEDADTYLFGSHSDTLSYFRSFAVIRDSAMLNIELLIAQLIGPATFHTIAQSFIAADKSRLSRHTVVRRLGIIRSVI